MKHLFLSLISFVFAVNLYAQHAGNPIITHMYTADPAACVFNDTLFVYTSHDTDSATWFNMYDWHVFSTSDMVHWKDHGAFFSLEDISWADEFAWAPDCAKYNGKYYFYYPVEQNFIGVAVGDKPWGPFEDPLGEPLITRQTPGVVNNRDLIDPAVFIDTDNTPYLYFGQNDVCMVELNEDMTSFNDSVTVVEGTDGFFEAVWVHKYNGMYYISYSGHSKDGKKILYGMSDSPYGPFEYKDVVLDKMNSGTNHHSIVEYKGQWYLFYHNSDLYLENNPDASEDDGIKAYRRSVCVDSLFYNEDGTIQKVESTDKGVQIIQ